MLDLSFTVFNGIDHNVSFFGSLFLFVRFLAIKWALPDLTEHERSRERKVGAVIAIGRKSCMHNHFLNSKKIVIKVT